MKNIILVGIVVRMAMFLVLHPFCHGSMANHRVWDGDAQQYCAMAENLRHGHGFSMDIVPPYRPDNFRAPLYPLFISMLGSQGSGILFLQVFLFVPVLLVMRKTNMLIFNRRMASCEWIYATCPLDIICCQSFLTESLFLVPYSLVWYFCAKYYKTTKIGSATMAGAMLGISALVRPSAYLMLWAILPGIFLCSWRKAAASSILLIASFYLVVAPWTLRNLIQLGTMEFCSGKGMFLLYGHVAMPLGQERHIGYVNAVSECNAHLMDKYIINRDNFNLAYWMGQFTNVVLPSTCHEKIKVDNLAALSDAQCDIAHEMMSGDMKWTLAKWNAIGLLRIAYCPPWQELMRLCMPSVDSSKLASSVSRLDFKDMRRVGWPNVVLGVFSATLLTMWQVLIVALAILGFVNMLKSRWQLCAMYALATVYCCATCASFYTSRYFVAFIPWAIPLASCAIEEHGLACKWAIQYAWLTTKHKWFVLLAGIRIGAPLHLLLLHDLDKYGIYSLVQYGRQFFGDQGDPMGFSYAWLRHQHTNMHHWEAWVPITGHSRGGFKDLEPMPMPRKYVLEMFADWCGASRAYSGKWPSHDSWEWFDQNVPGMRLHKDTRISILGMRTMRRNLVNSSMNINKLNT